MISQLIPQPYRDRLITAAKFAICLPRNGSELAAVAKIIDEIRKDASKEHPGLFRAEIGESHDPEI